MQGYILTMGSERSLILGDDGVRYTFASLEWQNDDMKPEVGMRVDFEFQGSDATDIYPIPGAPPMPPIQPSSPAPSTTRGVSPTQQPIGPSADGRFKATVRRIHTELETHYSPIRGTIGNYGAIAAGIALLAVSALIRFDILAAVLDFIGMAGMLVGAAIAAVGVFMLGKEEGWWAKSNEFSGQVGDAPQSPGDASKSHGEIERGEMTTSEDGDIQLADATGDARRMKNCPYCAKVVLHEAIKCRYCHSDIP